MEFLVNSTVSLPLDLTDGTRQDLLTREAARSKDLVAQGLTRRVWRVPGKFATWSLWHASDATELHAALSSLPLWPYMTIEVHALAAHPGDPA